MAGASDSTRTKFDDSRWPIVVATPPPKPLVGEAFDAHCSTIFGCYERGRSFGLVMDVRESATLTAAQRRIIAEQVDAHALRYPRVKLYVAVVLSSAVQRGIVKAITWLSRQPVPTEVFATLEEGIAWASKRLASESSANAAPPP